MSLNKSDIAWNTFKRPLEVRRYIYSTLYLLWFDIILHLSCKEKHIFISKYSEVFRANQFLIQDSNYEWSRARTRLEKYLNGKFRMFRLVINVKSCNLLDRIKCLTF